MVEIAIKMSQSDNSSSYTASSNQNSSGAPSPAPNSEFGSQEEWLENSAHNQSRSSQSKSDPEEGLEEALYQVNFVVFTREFSSQKSPVRVGEWLIEGSSPDEFNARVWERAKLLIKKEIVQLDDKYEWGSEEITAIDINRYFLSLHFPIIALTIKLFQVRVVFYEIIEAKH